MKQVLVVDDDENIRQLVTEGIKPCKVTVHGVSSAKEAIAYMGSHEVDLLISDIMLPDLKGTELFAQLRKKRPILQCIIFTAHPTRENIESSLKLGISDFVKKPCDIPQLFRIVSETLSRIDRWKNLMGVLESRTTMG